MDLHFCRECNNILYPKEDPDQHILYLSCRNCEHFEDSPSNIIFQKYSQQAVESTMSAHSKDLATDKTLPRTNRVNCLKCNKKNAVYFQTKDRQEEALTIHFVCCECDHLWSNNKMY
ncbi:hypothetical protein BDAP_000439 [Binucleata daphniae]